MAEIGFVPLAAGGAVKFGTYTGDGAASRTINLGITPKWVYVCNQYGQTYFDNFSSGSYFYGGLVGQGYPNALSGLSIVSGGFTIAYSSSGKYSNEQGAIFYYLYGV